MRIRTPRIAALMVTVSLLCGLGAVAGCGSQQEQTGSSDKDALTRRARQVATAWDGSPAAATWRAGYYPMGELVQLPEGGLHDAADKQAYEKRNFLLHGTLPDAGAKVGRVRWSPSDSLTRPLVGAADSYQSLAATHSKESPHLTVTGVKLGIMTAPTSRGPASVPAWLFTLDGYDTPLRQAAAVRSKFPTPPIKPAHDLPGYPIEHLVRISADGRAVSVLTLHGACDEGSVVDAWETHGSVVLAARIKHRQSSGNCTKQALFQKVTVQLKRPLGNRVLLDGLTATPVVYRGLRGTSPGTS
ncbi:hypothetical protein ABII15_00500 [Streptomyces sp. HUAS MG91]|uniref:Lipoprotein n=1 Tax=Streptomyces tabacisoli TaxID=3156398 RepID=A0AAU8IKY2_9ACTN